MARFFVYCLIFLNAHLILASCVHAITEGKRVVAAEAPRKLGNHNNSIHSKITAPSSPSPSEAGESTGSGAAQEQVTNIHHHYHHRTVDKSVAGGGVILGALATGFLVAVFCYIRATRRKDVETGSSSDSSVSGKKINVPSGSPVHP